MIKYNMKTSNQEDKLTIAIEKQEPSDNDTEIVLKLTKKEVNEFLLDMQNMLLIMNAKD